MSSALKARQHQRTQQQGRGRPINSGIAGPTRVVEVGGRLHTSTSWKTFHDFLFYYLRFAMGAGWVDAELKKSVADRHPVLRWYSLARKYQASVADRRKDVQMAPMTGAVEAFLALAYNLYLLAHNATLQTRLIARLKDLHQFQGAYYETYVAAAFIKAGFTLELENETDVSSKHCEFTATYPETDRRFSVEAKARQPGKKTGKVSNQLYAALQKRAAHPRVVFIEVNLPDETVAAETERWLEEALTSIRAKETTMTIRGEPAPSAYVFLTNHPYDYNLESTDFRRVVVSEGFKIPDYRLNSAFSSVRDARLARERHREVFALMNSIRIHYEIPVTFDGEIPEFAFGTTIPRLIIGNRYEIPEGSGSLTVGTLTDVTVSERERLAYGIYLLEDGRSVAATCPLTPEELSAYRRYPDTVFGVYRQQSKNLTDPLDLFDWFHGVYGQTPKENLLALIGPDAARPEYSEKDQSELAILYCEGLVHSVLASGAPRRIAMGPRGGSRRDVPSTDEVADVDRSSIWVAPQENRVSGAQ